MYDPDLGIARQGHLDKPAGGVRPISLLEEALKAMDGLLAQRKTEVRAIQGKGRAYSALNRC